MAQPRSVAELVSGARAGDQDAWDALVEQFLPMVTGTIRRFRLTDSDADDVNQTVWLRLVEHLDRIREPQALPGWLATTTRNEALRVVRARRRALPVDPQGGSLEQPADEAEVGDRLVRELRGQALREAVLELPAARRELLELLLTDPPLPYAEIGARLGIPVGSIGPTRARALEQLRHTRALRPWISDESSDGEKGGGRDVAVG